MADRVRWLGPWRCLAVLTAALAIAAAPTHAGATQSPAKSAILVIDANTGRVLHQRAADEPRYPASLTKMMTIYLAFELIEQGRLSYQTRIKFSANAVAAAPSKLDIAEGEEISLLDAIRFLITKSANDVAIAVAEHIAGSEERFAEFMTRKARQLGMHATTFRNASGLPDPQQVTTARDMVTLALRLQDDFPRHYPLFATRTSVFNDEIFRNHNSLLFRYEGTDGLKTGYTRASGFNLVVSVRRGRKHVVGAVFGGASAALRDAAMRTFLNMGLVKASGEKTRRPAALIAQANAPAPDRRIGPVPKPERVPRSSSPSIASVPPSAEPGAPQLRPSAPPIEMARVRTVLVGEPAPNPAADEPREGATEPPGPPAAAWPTSAAAAPSPRWPTALSDKPAFFSDPGLGRGALPSTLDEQAANIARGAPALATPAPPMPPPRGGAPARMASAPAVPAAAPPPMSAGPFQIQVGAFQSEAEAQRRLATVRERAAAVLADGAPVTLRVLQGTKPIYRARYTGFEAPAAARVCEELRKLKFDCIVVRAE
jgi:D-alanyl-D-alanine carboxypeptidase